MDVYVYVILIAVVVAVAMAIYSRRSSFKKSKSRKKNVTANVETLKQSVSTFSLGMGSNVNSMSSIYPSISPDVRAMVLKEVEYIFSPKHLSKDLDLRREMDSEGYVSIEELISRFRTENTKWLCDDTSSLIVASVSNSMVVETQGRRIRKRDGWKLWLIANTEAPPPIISKSGSVLTATGTNSVNRNLHKRNTSNGSRSSERRRSLDDEDCIGKTTSRNDDFCRGEVNDDDNLSTVRRSSPRETAVDRGDSIDEFSSDAVLRSRGDSVDDYVYGERIVSYDSDESRRMSEDSIASSSSSINDTVIRRHHSMDEFTPVSSHTGPSVSVSHARPSPLRKIATLVQRPRGGSLDTLQSQSKLETLESKRFRADSTESVDSVSSVNNRQLDREFSNFMKDRGENNDKKPSKSKKSFQDTSWNRKHYKKFHSKALCERHLLGPGLSREMNTLFRFWNYFLRSNFSSHMYCEFKKLSLEDANHSFRYGIECLFRFYSYGLEKKFWEDLWYDFCDLVEQDYANSNLYGLEKLWAFIYYNKKDPRDMGIQTSLLEILDKFHSIEDFTLAKQRLEQGVAIVLPTNL